MTLVPSRLAVAAGIAAALVLTVPAPRLAADQGMWTLDHLPVQRLKEDYGFVPSPDWIEHLQQASVSFGGGSGAFVSPGGLVITNHHVARGQLQKVSTPEHNYAHDGFYARGPAEELQCPDLELRVLMSSEDVSARVRQAVDGNVHARKRDSARRLVRRLFDGTADPGENQVVWDGTDDRGLPSRPGACFLRMSLDGRPMARGAKALPLR